MLRRLAAILAAWFVVFMTMAVPLHSCPMHDGMVGTLMGDAPGAMPMMPMGHDQGGAPAQSGGGHQHCTCVGSCDCGMARAIIGAAEVALPLPAPVRPLEPATRAAEPVLARAPHRLPFANGPPAAPHARVA